MPKTHNTPPSYLQVPLKSLVEGFLHDENDVNLMWKLEQRFIMLTPDESKDMDKELCRKIKAKEETGKTTINEQVMLGMAFEFGAGVNNDMDAAKHYYQPLEKLDYPPVVYRLGMMNSWSQPWSYNSDCIIT